jgi:hypothetical protein
MRPWPPPALSSSRFGSDGEPEGVGIALIGGLFQFEWEEMAALFGIHFAVAASSSGAKRVYDDDLGWWADAGGTGCSHRVARAS